MMIGVPQLVNLTSRFLKPCQGWSTNSCRTYVKAFWTKNNDSPYIVGHTRNPPKMRAYVRNQRNIRIQWQFQKPNEFKRMRQGYEQLMKTPQGRLKIMKKYLEKSPYLGEVI